MKQMRHQLGFGFNVLLFRIYVCLSAFVCLLRWSLDQICTKKNRNSRTFTNQHLFGHSYFLVVLICAFLKICITIKIKKKKNLDWMQNHQNEPKKKKHFQI